MMESSKVKKLAQKQVKLVLDTREKNRNKIIDRMQTEILSTIEERKTLLGKMKHIFKPNWKPGISREEIANFLKSQNDFQALYTDPAYEYSMQDYMYKEHLTLCYKLINLAGHADSIMLDESTMYDIT